MMVQRFKDHKEHEQLRGQVAEEIAKALHSAKPDRQCTLKLKDKTLNGIGLSATVGPVTIQQDFYSFSAGGDSIVLVLQDTPDDNGQPSGDRTRAEKMLSETLQLSAE